jgi:nucleoside-diphosphate-sugar epimerase
LKNILTTGANSYIGTSFEKWMKQWPDKYHVDTVDMIDGSWKDKDFSKYDTVFHVAGIAHVSSDPQQKELYYKVNRDLTIETAKKAKAEGVKQFIFMSSIIVYSDSEKKDGVITYDTIPHCKNFYGDSKIQAEEGISLLNAKTFKIVVLRPPMIYGKGSKGNYPKLSELAQKTPIFPDYDNKRSMLYIENLCEFIRLIIDNNDAGLFFPQNKEYVKTSELVRCIARVHNKKIYFIKWFNLFLNLLVDDVNIINKLFGNLVYEQDMSDYKEPYRTQSLEESIIRTEA